MVDTLNTILLLQRMNAKALGALEAIKFAFDAYFHNVSLLKTMLLVLLLQILYINKSQTEELSLPSFSFSFCEDITAQFLFQRIMFFF